MRYSELGFDRASRIFNDPGNFPISVWVLGREVSLTYQDFSRLVVQGVDFEIDDAVVERLLAKSGDGAEGG